jgi:hypothetical protein
VSEAGWHRDPHGRNEHRFFDGSQWTEHVSNGGQTSVDSVIAASPAQLAVPTLTAPHPPAPAPPLGALPSYQVSGQSSDGAKRPGNGMAVVALVLGIIGVLFGLIPLFFFIAIPCGVLALIFGFVGRRAAKRRAAGHRGMALVGLILGIVAVGLGIVGVVIVGDAVEDVDSAFDDAFGPASPDEFDITVETCGTDDSGLAEATGTITNTSDREQAFSVTLHFLDGQGVRVADAVDYVAALSPGATARWEANPFEEVPTDVTCDAIVE